MIYSEYGDLDDINTDYGKVATYNNRYKCKYRIERCSSIVSESIKLSINYSQEEHKRDITLKNIDYIRISGFVLDDQYRNVRGVYVTLYKVEVINYRTEYIPIADTISDENGLFQFIITDNNIDVNFKVKASDYKNAC